MAGPCCLHLSTNQEIPLHCGRHVPTPSGPYPFGIQSMRSPAIRARIHARHVAMIDVETAVVGPIERRRSRGTCAGRRVWVLHAERVHRLERPEAGKHRWDRIALLRKRRMEVRVEARVGRRRIGQDDGDFCGLAYLNGRHDPRIRGGRGWAIAQGQATLRNSPRRRPPPAGLEHGSLAS
jgi:hypothetical protein